MLVDQRRLTALATAVLVLAAAGAALAIAASATQFALRLALEEGENMDVEVAAPDLASAAARAIRDAERDGRRVSKLELTARGEPTGDR